LDVASDDGEVVTLAVDVFVGVEQSRLERLENLFVSPDFRHVTWHSFFQMRMLRFQRMQKDDVKLTL
jgi:hypothetical protein